MTKLHDLTPLQRRVMLAEAAGLNPYRWQFRYQHEEGWSNSERYTSLEDAECAWRDDFDGPSYADPIQRIVATPNYDANLNDCHQLEAWLTDEQHDRFRIHMRTLCGEDGVSFDFRQYLSSPASMRASALLLTLCPEVEL